MPHSTHQHSHTDHPAPLLANSRSLLGWPAWLRVLAVLPSVLLLWLAVWWANNMGVVAW